MKIRASKQLFDRWWALGERVMAIKKYIQYDSTLDVEEVFDFQKEIREITEIMKSLQEETTDWILQDVI